MLVSIKIRMLFPLPQTSYIFIPIVGTIVLDRLIVLLGKSSLQSLLPELRSSTLKLLGTLQDHLLSFPNQNQLIPFSNSQCIPELLRESHLPLRRNFNGLHIHHPCYTLFPYLLTLDVIPQQRRFNNESNSVLAKRITPLGKKTARVSLLGSAGEGFAIQAMPYFFNCAILRLGPLYC